MTEVWDDHRITAFGMLLEAHGAVLGAVARDRDADPNAARLPVTWMEVLLRLARSPDERLRMTELAAQVALSTSGLTRLVDRLEAAGLIHRQACPSDRRGFFAVLTDDGRDVLRRALPGHLDSLQRHVIDPLGAERVDELVELLRTLRDAARHRDGDGNRDGARTPS